MLEYYYADLLLSQFQEAITHHEFFKTLFLEYQLTGSNSWFSDITRNDFDSASLFKARLNDPTLDGYLYSLLFPSLLGKEYEPPSEVSDLFPLGIPVANKEDPFILEDATNWTVQQAKDMPRPFISYLHFFPPHKPYNTREQYANTFLNDGYIPPLKPPDPYALRKKIFTREDELYFRQIYDEYILYVDAEFNRLFDQLEHHGILENTMVVLTSDHGELFERNINGHKLP